MVRQLDEATVEDNNEDIATPGLLMDDEMATHVL